MQSALSQVLAQKPVATIVDVAKRCGLSITTVSHALGNGSRRSKIPEKTVGRVLRAANELNYRPSWRGRALAQRKNFQIGVLYRHQLPEMRAVYFDLMSELNDHLLGAGYHMMFVPMHGEDWLRSAGDPRFDACVLTDGASAEHVDRMLLADVPNVLLNSVDDPRVNRVLFDDLGGSRQAVDHLVGLGHRQIAYYFSRHPVSEHPSVRDRREGVRIAMRDYGLGDSLHLFEGEIEEGISKARFGAGGITAVICYHDADFIDVMSMLQRRGLRLPVDVSLVCFNDVYPLPQLCPSGTCLSVPGGAMGRIAAEILIEQLRGGVAEVRRVVVPETLVVRESTARPPAAT
jgi:DNA-binding LacI/PurR family transcriptional regulator